MLTREDIEGFLDRLSAEGVSYEEIEQGLWIVRPGGNLELDVVVHYSPPVNREEIFTLSKAKGISIVCGDFSRPPSTGVSHRK